MSNLQELLRQAHDLGARFRVVSGRIQIEGPSPLPEDLMAELREHKSEVRGFDRGMDFGDLVPTFT